MNESSNIQHFILTRFNLLLWNKDKDGEKVRTTKWLEHRFELFAKYCLPSVKSQTCQDFEWIVLFDSTTPEKYKARIADYERECPRFIPIYVEPVKGRCYAEIFRQEVVKRLTGQMVVTTYLDNDDALDIHFVEDIQRRAPTLPNGTFITYDIGYQFFTDHNYMMSIHFPKNHFMSLVESGNPTTVKTIYGYGSHYYIDKIQGVRMEHIKNQPMWCEVIHEKNMGNDAYFLQAKMIRDGGLLRQAFAVDETVNSSCAIYFFKFIPRYFKTFIRRIGYFLWCRHW